MVKTGSWRSGGAREPLRNRQGERVVKLRAAALSVVVTVAATPAMAQYWYAPGPYAGPYGDVRPHYAPAPYGYGGVAPYEIMAIVRSANLQPISRPWRNGANFVVRAMNARGDVVRVVVDGYRGRILAVTPAETAPTARLTPDPRDAGTAPQYDEDGNRLPPRPAPHAQRPGTEQNRTAAVTPVRPPMPRPRPADAPIPAAAEKPAPAATPAAATAPAPTPPAPAPAANETTPQPPETPTAPSGNGTTGSTPTGAGSGSAFPPVAPLE
jgi:hypothetical protein